MVPAFEQAFAVAHDLPYGVASTSGTAAIHVALGALDLEPGDEIITAPITDLGTVIPIISQGAIPVFADIDDTYTIDPVQVERLVTPRTRAIVAVHLFGNPCDMTRLRAIARRHGLVLIEDCAQAHLAEYHGRLVGTIGDIGCFSFQQSKHMTTGDGGMTVTANARYYERMKLFADKGFARRGFGPRAYLFHAPNYRMTELVAAVGLAQLEKLPRMVARRRELGARLTDALAGMPDVISAPVTSGAVHSYWIYPLAATTREAAGAVVARLARAGLPASLGYTGKPIYLCSESLTSKRTYGRSQWPFTAAPPGVTYEYAEGLCPRAEEILQRLVCIALDETWSEAMVDRAAAAIREAVAAGTGAAGAVSRRALSGSAPPARLAARGARSADEKSGAAIVDRPNVRVGIVGCGQMGQWHLEAYRRLPGVELVAVADENVARARAFADRIGGRTSAHPSHAAMLESTALDAVSICTPPATHRAIALAALEAGAHVLCEKPLAATLAEAEEMAAAAARRQRVLLTAFKFRFFDEVARARDLLARGLLGDLVHARLVFGGFIDMSGSWYADPALSGGGVLLDNGPHAFDLARYLLGDIASIEASMSRHQPIAVEDTVNVRCELARGGVLTIVMSWSLPVPARHYLELYGTQGTALLELGALTYRLHTWPEWKHVAGMPVKNGFARQVEHFVAAVRGCTPTITTLADGVEAQRLVDAAYRSLRTGRAVAPALEDNVEGMALDRRTTAAQPA